ncbi:AAA family ATPase [Halomonas sp. SL1]|uniref:AAA family ATPase n=1 Tax=Halomonas sp. SL1 TaxID=2137478 RepID=UPI0015EB4525|nr:AAA family ATPase [Halomonas sp. SL1]
MTLTASLSQVRRIIETQLHLLWSFPCCPQLIAPLMLWGSPGIGKSRVVREVCEAAGIGFVDVRLSQMEPVDLRGIPVPDGDSVKWLVASHWPRDPESRGILLLDELSAADRSMQVAAYELLLDRRLGDLYQLPDGWLAVAAGNGVEDHAVSAPMSSALANRLLHLDVEADIESWSAYAVAQGIHPDILAFLRFKPEYLLANEDTSHAWASPRSWERVSALLMSEAHLDEATERLMIHGLVGETACHEFMAFRDLSHEKVDIPAMLRGEVPVSIPTRTDLKLAFCAAVSQHVWKGDEDAQDQRLEVFFEVGVQLSSDLATLMLIDALRSDHGCGADALAEQMFAHPGFQQWLELHGLPMEQIDPEPDTGLPDGRFLVADAATGPLGEDEGSEQEYH